MRANVKQAGAGASFLSVAQLFHPCLSKDLEREVGVPVLNTKAIGIRFAEMCVQLAMTQSALINPLRNFRTEDFTASARNESKSRHAEPFK